MRPRWASSPIILLAYYAKFILCAPRDYFPINSQLPPVARISEPFSFVFSPSTFVSPYPISYTLVDSPEWLSIDSNNRRLYGTPEDRDVGSGSIVGVPISIAAEDEQGSTITNSTLVISRNPAPNVVVPLSEQLPSFGLYSAPSSIILSPSEDFSFKFKKDTFDQSGLSYYAVSGDNAPLPAWISFDANSISFTGRTPAIEALVQPPTTFNVKLVASDVVGFASASIPFSIIVGNHELTAEVTNIASNASIGRPFHYDDLANNIKLDGGALNRSNVASISTTPLPEWLEFDTETWHLSGTPQVGAIPVNVTISVVDIYSDALNISLVIDIAMNIFRSDLPTINVSAGTDLALDLRPFISNISDTELRLTDQSKAPWIRYNSSLMELTGAIPYSNTAFEVQVDLEASSKSTEVTESRELSIRIGASPSETTRPSSSSSSAAQTPASTSSVPAAPSSTASPTSRTTKIVLGVLVPLIVICVVALVLLLCCYRRRRHDRYQDHIPEVSAPIPGSFVKHNTSSLEGPNGLQGLFDAEVARRSHSDSFTTAPVIPPRFRTSSHSSVRGSDGRQSMTLFAFDRRSLSDSAVRETRESWLKGFAAGHIPPSTATAKMDDFSVLSDTTLGSADNHVQGETPALVVSGAGPESFRRSLVTSPVAGLSLPIVHEPSSIQATPEFAYITRGSESDGESRPKSAYPDSTYSGVLGLGIQRTITSIPRKTSTRMSHAWKKASPSRLLEEYKRKSNHSTSTVDTTRTSILTDEVADIQRPTVVHVPSRGQSRQISRRVDDSSALFGGGAIVRSPKNFGVITGPSPMPSREKLFMLPPPLSHGRNFSWNNAAKRSHGIEHRDFGKSQHEPIMSMNAARASQDSVIFSPLNENKENNDLVQPDIKTYEDLMSLNQWPMPLSTANSDTSTIREYKDPARDDSDVSRAAEEKARLLEQQQAAEDVRRLLSEPDPAWPLPRPLPKTPTRQARTPLADRPNQSATSGGGLGTRSNFSRKSNRSVNTIASDYAGTEDGWEDIRPASVLDGNLFSNSTGSAPAFI
ncbi:hypothetical protein PFICI_13086 [Pestalotiopsis fici W106-1]|uniref:Dystroglycan-type cadherin-like domain-containing protein n=1 Tax=Pestalotiopsis fici (strain W106-1 / CGMCC3.15140) TaxID=1229662 RepID=W3WN56_PESFW|nr:uncharacterized protein PFICI_13086 [Pestalotiopsis fici W106-1]ETS74602.1 hypothetical protein PFICI_13086 [Pestalotiopsis fici W106-1]